MPTHYNLLLTRLVGETNHIRQLGYRRVIKARQSVSKNERIREFVPSKLNFEADDYTSRHDFWVSVLNS